jgi:hypothetical protein
MFIQQNRDVMYGKLSGEICARTMSSARNLLLRSFPYLLHLTSFKIMHGSLLRRGNLKNCTREEKGVPGCNGNGSI